MLDPVIVLQIAGQLVLPSWIALAVSLFVPQVRRFVWPATQFVVPALFAAAYVPLIAVGMGAEGGGFGSLTEIRALFADDSALAAGWLHYLAFDLFVGTWIVRDGLRRHVHPLLLLACLPPVLLFGPAGLLLYLLFRIAFRCRAGEEKPL
jgi:hypothetical protein